VDNHCIFLIVRVDNQNRLLMYVRLLFFFIVSHFSINFCVLFCIGYKNSKVAIAMSLTPFHIYVMSYIINGSI